MTTSSLSVVMVAVVAAAVAVGSSPYRAAASSGGRIYVAGLIPVTSKPAGDTPPLDDDASAPDVLDAVLMARDHVNRDRRILPNHELDLVWNDTQVCDPATRSCRVSVAVCS